MKMISDDLTTPVSTIMTLFVARRRFGRIYYDTTWSFCWWAGDEQFGGVEEVVKTRVKAVKKRERCVNMHAERRTRKLEWRGSKSGSKTYVEGMEAWDCVCNLVAKKVDFSKEKKKSESKSDWMWLNWDDWRSLQVRMYHRKFRRVVVDVILWWNCWNSRGWCRRCRYRQSNQAELASRAEPER